MITRFLYEGAIRRIGFYYAGPPWILLLLVIWLTIILWIALS